MLYVLSSRGLKQSAGAAALSLVALAGPAQALEHPAARGYMGFFSLGAGYLPPANTTTISVNYLHNDWNKLTGSDGHNREPFSRVDAQAWSSALGMFRMSDYQLLGADYGFGLVLPYVSVEVGHTMEVQGQEVPIEGNHNGLSAIFLTPLALAWRDPTHTFNHNLMLTAGIPSGNFDGDNAANVSEDHYSLTTMYQFTYGFGEGWEASSALSYRYNFRNKHDQHPTTAGPEGRYKNGDTMTLNLSVGKNIGPWGLGVAGYWLKQLNEDDIQGADDFDGLKAEAWGVGPVATFYDRSKPYLPRLALKYSAGLDSRDAVTGDFVNLTMSYTF